MTTRERNGAWASNMNQAVHESEPGEIEKVPLVGLQESGPPIEELSSEPAALRESWMNRTWVRLFGPVVLKAAGSMILLSLVAWLGHYSKNEAQYGTRVEPADIAASPKGDRVEAAGEHEHKSPTPVAAAITTPRCPEVKKKPSVGILSDGKVVINEATAEELTKLPGVGKSRAEAIVKLRTRLGRFKKLSDLLRIRGIGWRTLKKMKDMAVVERPKSVEAPGKAKASDLRAEAPNRGDEAANRKGAASGRNSG